MSRIIVLAALSAGAFVSSAEGQWPHAQLSGLVKSYPQGDLLGGVAVVAMTSRAEECPLDPDYDPRVADHGISGADGSYSLDALPPDTDLEIHYCLGGYRRNPTYRHHRLEAAEIRQVEDVELATDDWNLMARHLLGTADLAAEVQKLETFGLAPRTDDQLARALTAQARERWRLEDLFFEPGGVTPEGESVTVLHQAAEFLKATPFIVRIEAHDDERGTNEEALALSDRRAETVRRMLEGLGAPSSSIQTIGYGEERPVCTESTEACWRQNRRVSFEVRLPEGG